MPRQPSNHSQRDELRSYFGLADLLRGLLGRLMMLHDAVQVGHSFAAKACCQRAPGHCWLGIVRLVTCDLEFCVSEWTLRLKHLKRKSNEQFLEFLEFWFGCPLVCWVFQAPHGHDQRSDYQSLLRSAGIASRNSYHVLHRWKWTPLHFLWTHGLFEMLKRIRQLKGFSCPWLLAASDIAKIYEAAMMQLLWCSTAWPNVFIQLLVAILVLRCS